MKNALVLVSLWCCALAYSVDKDTLPLKKKTTSSGSASDRVESELLVPKKGGATSTNNAQQSGSPSTAGKGRMPQPTGPYIAGLDTFGSNKINETTIRQFLGKDLDKWIQKGLKADPSSLEDENKS